jgi:hypothetical protein
MIATIQQVAGTVRGESAWACPTTRKVIGMKSVKRSKLALNREAIKLLNVTDLHEVDGGSIVNSTVCTVTCKPHKTPSIDIVC